MSYIIDILKTLLTIGSKPDPLVSQNEDLKEQLKELKKANRYFIIGVILTSSWALIATVSIIEILMHSGM